MTGRIARRKLEEKRKERAKWEAAKPPVFNGRLITPKLLRKAIKDSFGIRATICKRLRITRANLEKLLTNPEGCWNGCRTKFSEEGTKVDDIARDSVLVCMQQRDHLPTALKAAEFHLQRRVREEYGETKTLVLEGGEKAIKTDGRTEVSMDVISQLPVEARKALLAAIEGSEPSAPAAPVPLPKQHKKGRKVK